MTTLVSSTFDVERTWGFTSEDSVRELVVVIADPTTTTTSSTTSTTSPPTSTTAPPTTTSTSTSTSSTTSSTLFSCGSGPATGCQPAAAQRARLQLGTGRLRWKWTSSATVAVDDFGTPTSGTDYVFCVYDSAGPQLTAQAPNGDTCGTRPCWRAISSVGFRYADRDGTPDGLKGMRLKAGAAGRARLQVKGSGANLDLPALPVTTPLVAQLRRSGSGACWEATYSSPLRNDGSQFKAKSD